MIFLILRDDENKKLYILYEAETDTHFIPKSYEYSVDNVIVKIGKKTITHTYESMVKKNSKMIMYEIHGNVKINITDNASTLEITNL